jgi:tetratricopeptide (TPR) repeat protein
MIHAVKDFNLHGTLSGHMGKVNDLLFKDNETLLSASTDGTIKTWDVTNLKPVFSLACKDEPKRLVFNAQKNWLLSMSRDSVSLWDLNTGQALGNFIDDSELFAMDATDVVVCGGKSGGFHILKVILPKEKVIQEIPVRVEEKIQPPPADAAELEKLGKTCLDTGRYGQALECFTNALKVKPDDLNLLFYRATVLTRSGMYEDAIAQLDYILDNNLAPGLNLGYAYVGKANALVSLKRYQESLEYYQKAIQIVNNVRSFWYMQGYALYCLSKFDLALESLQKAEAMSSDEQTREFIGWCQLGVKKFDEAWDTFTKLTTKAPRDILSWYGLGLAAKAVGNKEQARESLGKFLESTRPEHMPHHPRVKEILLELSS